MARIETMTHIEAEPARVWEVLADWERQPQWMQDARSVTVLSPHREGVDVVVRCRTDLLGGLVVTDDMVTTEWEQPRVIGVRHLGGLIRGVGAFELEASPYGTRFTWWEEIDPPFGALGESLTSVLLAPHVQRLFRTSLAALKRVCESTSVRP